jgi:hypothetical protein
MKAITELQRSHPKVSSLDITCTNNEKGVVSTSAGSSKGYRDGFQTIAQFNGPVALTMDDENVLVVDQYNHKIRKITPNGTSYFQFFL